jgi:hypothetical protein
MNPVIWAAEIGSKMERAAGLAAARGIPRELYYHRCTTGVKWKIGKQAGKTLRI